VTIQPDDPEFLFRVFTEVKSERDQLRSTCAHLKALVSAQKAEIDLLAAEVMKLRERI
jgi:hypothetical protein